MFFIGCFTILACICGFIQYQQWHSEQKGGKKIQELRKNFFIGYCLAAASDWIQGAYMYSLYEKYGLSEAQIALIFVIGFGSSSIFGTFIASISDSLGRKNLCIAYAVTYILSCATKFFPDFTILALGRLFGGIATSIFFSCFEAWLVHEHQNEGYDGKVLEQTFSLQTFFNGTSAIASGLLANFVYDMAGEDDRAPFLAAIVLLLIGGAFIYLKWPENYGKQNEAASQSFTNSFKAINEDKRLLLLCAIQSLFESGMYLFVMLWTPILRERFEGESVPLGLVFSTFMVAMMIGSEVFSYGMKQTNLPTLMCIMFTLSSICFIIAAQSTNSHLVMISFTIFELCVGIFWPGIASQRNAIIPSEVRSTMLNLFRVPVNFMVIFLLFQTSLLSHQTLLLVTAGFMSLCLACQSFLISPHLKQ
eukprot:gb/GECH01004238.1/.p1 GENE.gb/GECH01004238.1/~~gb/GECH01004238.1/.p1  ORF type:complete len:420 (+),score=71.47 gb/GECH01004238.1/:1-1260(+)